MWAKDPKLANRVFAITATGRIIKMIRPKYDTLSGTYNWSCNWSLW